MTFGLPHGLVHFVDRAGDSAELRRARIQADFAESDPAGIRVSPCPHFVPHRRVSRPLAGGLPWESLRVCGLLLRPLTAPPQDRDRRRPRGRSRVGDSGRDTRVAPAPRVARSGQCPGGHRGNVTCGWRNPARWTDQATAREWGIAHASSDGWRPSKSIQVRSASAIPFELVVSLGTLRVPRHPPPRSHPPR
jgi:hypothetical protein